MNTVKRTAVLCKDRMVEILTEKHAGGQCCYLGATRVVIGSLAKTEACGVVWVGARGGKGDLATARSMRHGGGWGLQVWKQDKNRRRVLAPAAEDPASGGRPWTVVVRQAG